MKQVNNKLILKGKSVIFFILLFLDILPSGAGRGSILLSQNVTINNTGSGGNTSAMLDVDAANKGLLIPRVGLSSATDIVTILAPATSLLIYNTSTAGSSPDNVIPGFYYWDGVHWISIIKQQEYADFYALMPGDNSATVAAGAAVSFPNLGPAGGTGITKFSATQFELASIGTYQVSWQVSVAQAGQLVLAINGVADLTTVVGRATGTSQISGSRIITTTVINSLLQVVNPTGNLTVLTITTNAGGAQAVSASLVITRLR